VKCPPKNISTPALTGNVYALHVPERTSASVKGQSRRSLIQDLQVIVDLLVIGSQKKARIELERFFSEENAVKLLRLSHPWLGWGRGAGRFLGESWPALRERVEIGGRGGHRCMV
jgi:hypothetical protein